VTFADDENHELHAEAAYFVDTSAPHQHASAPTTPGDLTARSTARRSRQNARAGDDRDQNNDACGGPRTPTETVGAARGARVTQQVASM
jgi:hypothetical protein